MQTPYIFLILISIIPGPEHQIGLCAFRINSSSTYRRIQILLLPKESQFAFLRPPRRGRMENSGNTQQVAATLGVNSADHCAADAGLIVFRPQSRFDGLR